VIAKGEQEKSGTDAGRLLLTDLETVVWELDGVVAVLIRLGLRLLGRVSSRDLAVFATERSGRGVSVFTPLLSCSTRCLVPIRVSATDLGCPALADEAPSPEDRSSSIRTHPRNPC
jgi:hypothetical protein